MCGNLLIFSFPNLPKSFLDTFVFALVDIYLTLAFIFKYVSTNKFDTCRFNKIYVIAKIPRTKHCVWNHKKKKRFNFCIFKLTYSHKEGARGIDSINLLKHCLDFLSRLATTYRRITWW